MNWGNCNGLILKCHNFVSVEQNQCKNLKLHNRANK